MRALFAGVWKAFNCRRRPLVAEEYRPRGARPRTQTHPKVFSPPVLFPTFCPEQTPVVLGTTRVQGPFRNFTFLCPTFCLDLTPAVLARKFGNESETCSFHSFLAAPPWALAGYCQHGSAFFLRHEFEIWACFWPRECLGNRKFTPRRPLKGL